jgi:hypothetical protein
VIDGGGGEWSIRKLQFYADKLMTLGFRLDSPAQLHALLQEKSENLCPEFTDNR